MTKTISTVQGDTLDLICHRHYGATSGIVEQVLKHNPHLADLGAILPISTIIELPDINTNQQSTQATVQLWG